MSLALSQLGAIQSGPVWSPLLLSQSDREFDNNYYQDDTYYKNADLDKKPVSLLYFNHPHLAYYYFIFILVIEASPFV